MVRAARNAGWKSAMTRGGNDNVPGTFVYVLLYRSLYGYLVY